MTGKQKLIQFPARQASLWAEPDVISPAEYDDMMHELDVMGANRRREFDIGDLRKPVRSASQDGRARAGKRL